MPMAAERPSSCCRCNGSGRCRNCVCVKANRPCSSCLPDRRGRCSNIGSSSQILTACGATTTNSGGTDPVSERDGESTPADDDSPADVDDDSPVDLLVPTQLSADRQDATIQELPCPAPMAEAHFTWGPGEVSAEQFIKSVKAAYSEVVHWNTTFFLSPPEKLAKLLSVRWLGCFDPMLKGLHLSPLPSQQQ